MYKNANFLYDFQNDACMIAIKCLSIYQKLTPGKILVNKFCCLCATGEKWGFCE